MKKPSKDTFSNVQNAIWGLLKFECFPRFKSSPFFTTPLNKKQVRILDNLKKKRIACSDVTGFAF